MAKLINIKRELDGRLTLRFYYDYNFIEQLKGAVPAGARDYDPPSHVWTVNDPGYEETVLELARRHFDSAIFEYKDDNNDLVTVNLKTGDETRIGCLF